MNEKSETEELRVLFLKPGELTKTWRSMMSQIRASAIAASVTGSVKDKEKYFPEEDERERRSPRPEAWVPMPFSSGSREEELDRICKAAAWWRVSSSLLQFTY